MRRERPEHFTCDACHETTHLDLLCTATARAERLVCVRCCACDGHDHREVDGTVIFPWRGLNDSEHRTRRQR